MIDILWENQMLTMFAIDVTVGCQEITGSGHRGLKVIGTWRDDCQFAAGNASTGNAINREASKQQESHERVRNCMSEQPRPSDIQAG